MTAIGRVSRIACIALMISLPVLVRAQETDGAATFTLTVTTAGTGFFIVSSTPSGISCGVDCTEVYDAGTVVTLHTGLGFGTSFTGWSGDADCTDGVVTMTANVACTATFSLATYPLNITLAGNGAGTVTSSPPGIDCGADCTEQYGALTPVTLTATPATGSVFAGWSGNPDCNDGSVMIFNSEVSCTATFTLLTFPLTVSTTGSGAGTVTSTPAGINCPGDCTEPFDFGSVVTLTPTPNTGSTFTGWTGDADCADGVVTMTAARSCTAEFTIQSFDFSVGKAGTGSGTVTSSPAGINCGLDCSEPFDFGTVVTLTATPDAGSTFVAWTGDADCADGVITIDSASTCTATFNASTAIPTLSEWAMLLMILALVVAGLRSFA